MKKKHYSWANPRPIGKTHIEMGPSITIPGQSMKAGELLDRYQRGMPLDTSNKTPLFYNGEFPDLSKMDLSEIHAMQKASAEQVRSIERSLKEREEKAKKDEQEKRDKELDDLKKQITELQKIQNNSLA